MRGRDKNEVNLDQREAYLYPDKTRQEKRWGARRGVIGEFFGQNGAEQEAPAHGNKTQKLESAA